MGKKVIVLDAETTGLDAKTDEILQLSILSEDGEVLFNNYFRPTKHTSWPDSEKIHHISYDMVKDGAAISYYKDEIQQILDSADTIVGYNHSFDMSFLEAAGIYSDPKKNYDLMLEFSQLKGDWDKTRNSYKWYKLKECADYFGYDWGTDVSHDALSDAKATLYCYKKMIAGETNKGGIKNKGQHPSAFRSSSKPSKIAFPKKFLAVPVILLLIIGIVSFLPRDPRTPNRKPKTISESTLQKVLNISDLSTLEFRYGSIAQAVDAKGKTKYYVTYDGTIQVGVDFSAIAKSISIDRDAKTITVTIPEPKVLSTNVNVDTLDYLFVKDKYNTTGLTNEALKLCKQDLANELKNNTDIFDIAKENTSNVISQLLEPWLKQADGEYTIVVK